MPTPEEIQARFDSMIRNRSTVLTSDADKAFNSMLARRIATSGNLNTWWSQRPENRAKAARLAEQESIEEQWDVPFVLATGGAGAFAEGLAGVSTLGRTIHGISTMLAATAGEYGVVKPLSKHAGRINPYLEPLVGVAGGLVSAVTLEAALDRTMIKALTKTAPKFWTTRLNAAKEYASIPEQYVSDLEDLAKRADEGDVKAAEELKARWNKVAYNNVKTKAEERLDKYWADYRAKQVSAESTDTVIEDIIKKGHLDDVEYERLSKVAERDAINEYAEEFDKIRKSIVNERAAAEWAEYPAKELVDHIIARGGVTESSVRKVFNGYTDEAVDKIIGNLKKRFPKLLAKEEGVGINQLAEELNQQGPRKMMADIAGSPGLARITRQKRAEFAQEFDRVYRDEIFIRTQEKTASYLAKVLKIDNVESITPKAAVKAIESGAPIENVVKELLSVRKNIVRMTDIIRKQTAKATGKIGREKLLKLRAQYAEQVSKYKALVKIEKSTSRIQSRLKTVLQSKTMLPEYKTQINTFLRPLFGGRRTRLDESMFEFLKRKYGDNLAYGADLLAVKYNDMLQGLGDRPFRFKDLSYAQIKDIDDFTKMFTFVARHENKIIVQGEKLYLDAVAQRIQSTAETAMSRFKWFRTAPTQSQLEKLNEGTLSAVGRFTRAASDIANGFFAHLKRMEPILRQLDGFEENGLAQTTIFKPIADSEIMEHRLGDTVFNAYEKIFGDHATAVSKGRRSKYWSARVPTEVAGMRFTKEATVAMALNSGSPDNLEVLQHGLGKTEEEIMEYINSNLNEADWKLVNDVWDHLENDLWPIMKKVYKDMTGATPVKVKGKYYPIYGSKEASEDASGIVKILTGADRKITRQELEKSFFKTRRGGMDKIELSLDPLVKHLRDVVHTSTHWKALSDAQRLIRNTQFRNAVENTMGPRIYDQFEPWINNLAKPFRTNPSNPGWEKTLRYARGATTIGVLGLVPKTAAKQTLSFITALPKIGTANAITSLTKLGVSPLEFMRSVEEASPQMFYRVRTWQREIAEMASTIKPGTIGTPGPVKNAFFKFIHTVDRMTSSVVWHGAYLKGLDKFKGNAHRAVDFADAIVRHTQPSSAAKDLPRIMRSGEGQRMITMFYSFFSVWHNQAAEIVSRGLAGDMSVPKALGTIAFLATAPVVTWELLSTAGSEITGRAADSEEMVSNMVKGSGMMALSGLPTIRDLGASALLGYDFKMSPVANVGIAGKETLEGLGTLFTDKEWERKHTLSAIEFIGYLSQLPSRQMVTTIEGALRLLNGETDDPTELLIKARKR